MKRIINYAPDIIEGATLTNLLPVVPFAYIDLENSGGATETIELVLNIPLGSMLNIDGLEISDIQNTSCGCPYRTCSLGITLAGGINTLTAVSVPVSNSLLTGAVLLLIEITDLDNPSGRPKGKSFIGRPGII